MQKHSSLFPDLHDAYDADELPLAFILWRDSRLTKGTPRERVPLRANDPVRRRKVPSRTRSRRGRRKQMTDR
jgi:hypothetical protein